jgi:hypothetical protein
MDSDQLWHGSRGYKGSENPREPGPSDRVVGIFILWKSYCCWKGIPKQLLVREAFEGRTDLADVKARQRKRRKREQKKMKKAGGQERREELERARKKNKEVMQQTFKDMSVGEGKNLGKEKEKNLGKGKEKNLGKGKEKNLGKEKEKWWVKECVRERVLRPRPTKNAFKDFVESGTEEEPKLSESESESEEPRSLASTLEEEGEDWEQEERE